MNNIKHNKISYSFEEMTNSESPLRGLQLGLLCFFITLSGSGSSVLGPGGLQA